MKNNQVSASFIRRWLLFIKERFPFASHIPLIAFVFAANALVAYTSLTLSPAIGKSEILGLLLIILVFLHLRIFDEIKDYDTDKLAHPHRPLARGLISKKEATMVAYAIILLELILAALLHRAALVGIICVICYSLLMYKEFFVREWIRKKLVFYAVSHSVISGIIALFIFSCVTERYIYQFPPIFGLFVLANMLLSNIYEFSRKTFAQQEEDELIDSYSKRFGPLGASLIVLLMAATSVFIGFILGFCFNLRFLFFIAMACLMILIAFVGLMYARTNLTSWAKRHRASGGLFILLYDVIITIGIIWNN